MWGGGTGTVTSSTAVSDRGRCEGLGLSADAQAKDEDEVKEDIYEELTYHMASYLLLSELSLLLMWTTDYPSPHHTLVVSLEWPGNGTKSACVLS